LEGGVKTKRPSERGGHFSAVEFAEMIGRFVSERL
jgi:hypothetical protein